MRKSTYLRLSLRGGFRFGDRREPAVFVIDLASDDVKEAPPNLSNRLRLIVAVADNVLTN